jgi:predicted nucleotidyltransferase/HEPN domain-containing protein
MKSNIDHLPETKRQELGKIAQIIRDQCPDTAMIILFGSYARGDYKVAEDLHPERKSGHVSDYDILVVSDQPQTVADTALWDRISNACDKAGLSAHARIITHDIQELNIKLAEGQYFFTDIRKEGCVLYDAGTVQLAEQRALTAEEQRRIAQDNFDHWFERASGFMRQYEHAMRDGDLKTAAFDLHQAAEACYKTVLLVHTNYNPNEHRLGFLGDLVVEEDASFNGALPRDSRQDRERFLLLDFAYIGARYDPRYRISRDDLALLAGHVQRLMMRTEKACEKKILSFSAE